jgi:hypothetical protein
MKTYKGILVEAFNGQVKDEKWKLYCLLLQCFAHWHFACADAHRKVIEKSLIWF